MTGELITTPAVALGVAGYLGSELLKPTLARVGDSVRDFLTARVKKVFLRAEAELSAEELGPPLEPGFLALFIQRVSFTEDEDGLTARWAHLLADAARCFANKHVNYVEILSQLGPVEVSLLEALVGAHPLNPRRPSNLQGVIRAFLRGIVASRAEGSEGASSAVRHLLETQLPWPAAVMSAEVGYFEGGQENYAVGGMARQGWDPIAIDVLIRQRLIEEFSVDISQGRPSALARLVTPTGLGLDFVRACRGLPDLGPT